MLVGWFICRFVIVNMMGHPMDAAGALDGYKAMNADELRLLRTKHGQCLTCGQQLFKIARYGAFKKKKPITLEGIVDCGRCLQCNRLPGDDVHLQTKGSMQSIQSVQTKGSMQSVQSANKSVPQNQQITQKSEPHIQRQDSLSSEAVDVVGEKWMKAVSKVEIVNHIGKPAKVPVPSVEIDEVSNDGVKVSADLCPVDTEESVEYISNENYTSKASNPPPEMQKISPNRKETKRRSTIEQMKSFLWSFEIQLIVETMLDLHENIEIQIEACKVLKDRSLGDMDGFVTCK